MQMKTENFMRSPNYYQHYNPFLDVCQCFLYIRVILLYMRARALRGFLTKKDWKVNKRSNFVQRGEEIYERMGYL